MIQFNAAVTAPDEDIWRSEIVEETRSLMVARGAHSDVDNLASALIGLFESNIS